MRTPAPLKKFQPNILLAIEQSSATHQHRAERHLIAVLIIIVTHDHDDGCPRIPWLICQLVLQSAATLAHMAFK
jgi:hypothetical protein